MERGDVLSALSLCRSAGWNQLSRDWEIFLALAPRGNRVCLNEDGNVVGTVTTIRYGDHFAWIGMVLVDPAHRRKGIGSGLLDQALNVLNDAKCVRLDATPEGRQVYTKLGFEDEYQLSRMVVKSADLKKLITSSRVTDLTAQDLEALRSEDNKVFGADRASLLSWMRDGRPDLAFKVVNKDRIEGFCLGRSGYNNTHIGPVVANSLNVAQELVTTALQRIGSKGIILDVTHHNDKWRAWLQSLGFSELRPFIRMYRGTNHNPGVPENQFAILGPEFG
jgi:ribosomal protein S18 acetylase RimI-like enzyme